MRTTPTSNVFPIDYFNFNTAGRQGDQDDRPSVSPWKVEQEFRAVLVQAGLEVDEIVSDGGVYRCRMTGEINSGSGWYQLYNDERPYGCYGTWNPDRGEFRQDWSMAVDHEMTHAEKLSYERRRAEAKAERDKARAEEVAAAAQRAFDEWNEATPVTGQQHQYLQAKNVAAYGIRLYRGSLVVPAMDADGNVYSRQSITANGDKWFMPGGEIQGHFYTIPGSQTIAIVEGYATGATVYEATGWTVVVGFSAHNLMPVAQAVRERHPQAEIYILGDTDPGGAGQNAAAEAAIAIGAKALCPDVAGIDDATDWNDIAAAKGMDEVRRQIESVKTAFGIARYAGSIAYLGEPTPIEWVVDGLFQKGAVSLIAGVGAAGKSMLMLDLCAKVGMPPVDSGESVIDLNWHTSLGNRVMSHGKAVVISAEDGRDELHRRVHALGYRGEQLGNVYLFPVPDEGGCKILMADDRRTNTIVTTPDWHALRRELHQIKPEILIIDPLASFVSADLDKDNRAGQQVMGMFDALARELNCAVVVVHHFAKGDRQPKSADEALKLVRGATALINRSRTVYVLWQAGKEGRALAVERVGECLAKDDVYQGCAAKQNTKGDKRTKVLIRSKDRAVLEVIATFEDVENACSAVAKADRLLADFIASETEATGRPFTKTGDAGPYARAKAKQSAGDKSPMVQAVVSIKRDEMGARIDALVDQGLIAEWRPITPPPRASKSLVYYDVKNGRLDRSGEYIEA